MTKYAYFIEFKEDGKFIRKAGEGGKIGGPYPFQLYTRRGAEQEVFKMGKHPTFFGNPTIKKLRL